jgi:tRNA threonylcarbamoyladenosine biosynthesis protein TsaE
VATLTFETASEEETSAVGQQIAPSLRRGDVILLYGELGAGKTAFVRGLARGLGASSDEVTSPTFTLIQEYRGPTTLYHVDLYRLDPREVDDLGLDELISSGGVVAIEWAERWEQRPSSVHEVWLEHLGGDKRGITWAALFIPPDNSALPS